MQNNDPQEVPVDTEVFIVGGGPVGLSMAILMERFGIRYVLVERSPTTTTHPKARGTWPRTMEIFRQWGVEDAIRKRGIADDADVFAFVESIAGHEYGRTRPEENIGQTPAWKVICSQDVVEEELLRITANFKHGKILYSNEFVELADGPDIQCVREIAGSPDAGRAHGLSAPGGREVSAEHGPI